MNQESCIFIYDRDSGFETSLFVCKLIWFLQIQKQISVQIYTGTSFVTTGLRAARHAGRRNIFLFLFLKMILLHEFTSAHFFLDFPETYPRLKDSSTVSR